MFVFCVCVCVYLCFFLCVRRDGSRKRKRTCRQAPSQEISLQATKNPHSYPQMWGFMVNNYVKTCFIENLEALDVNQSEGFYLNGLLQFLGT